jgi:hypothetical protein
VNRAPKFWIAVVAIVAVTGVLFVLITPALDELPSTGPHSLQKTFALISSHFVPIASEILNGPRLQFLLTTVLSRGNMLSLTCARLC